MPGIGITQNSGMNSGSYGDYACELNCRIYAPMNKTIVEAMVNPPAILLESRIFSPSSTPKGNKLNIAIHALNDAHAYKYE